MLTKTKTIRAALLTAATAACLPLTALAQDRPPRPAPPPPAPPAPFSRPQVFRVPARPVETAPQTYLGVGLRPVGPELAAHLGEGVPKGVGLGVEFVEPDSPAAQAGVQQYDVITKLDDQLVINPEQFTTLVRIRDKGDDAKLTVRRGGQEKVLDVTFGEKDLPVAPPPPQQGDLPFEAFPGPQGDGGMRGFAPDDQRLRDMVEQSQQRLRELLDRRGGPPIAPPPAAPPQFMPQFMLPPAGGVAEGGRVTMSDGKTTSTLVNDNGAVTLHIEDAKSGDVLYDGPYPDAEALNKLSPDVRAKVRQFEKFVGPPNAGPATPPATRPAGDEEREKVRA